MGKDFEVVCLPFDFEKDFSDEFNNSLSDLEKNKVDKAIDKRKAEFTFGRLCAKKAYKKLTGSLLNIQDITIENDSHGAPYLKDGNFSVSISHEDKLAVAVVSNRNKISLGVDLLEISEKNSSVIYKFLDDDEKELINNYKKDYDYNFLCSAFFSSKEALSKLLGYGFSVFPILKIDKLSTNQITFKELKNFKVTLFVQNHYIFAFAYFKTNENKFESENNSFSLDF